MRPSDAPAILDQYEALRREALESGPLGPRGQGLALFLSRGMADWLAALTALAWPVRCTPPGPALPREQAARLRPGVRAELTTVLAGMVLACTQPMEVRDA